MMASGPQGPAKKEKGMHEVIEHPAEHAGEHGGGRRLAALVGLTRVAFLLGFSAYFFALYGSGNARNFVNPEFNWLILVSAGIFLLLGLAGAAQWVRPR